MRGVKMYSSLYLGATTQLVAPFKTTRFACEHRRALAVGMMKKNPPFAKIKLGFATKFI